MLYVSIFWFDSITLDKIVGVSADLQTAVSNINRKILGARTLTEKDAEDMKNYYQRKPRKDDPDKQKWSESVDNSFGKIGLASMEGK